MAGYDRNKAVEYALRYGINPNPAYKYFESGGGDCTNFISQCLFAGKAPMSYSSKYPWWYSGNKWSFSWSVANSLYWCLKNRSAAGLKGLKGIEVAGYSELLSGDLIQYERGGRIYHTGIITGWADGPGGSRTPLITQHTYNAVNISWVKPAAEKVHFMRIVVT